MPDTTLNKITMPDGSEKYLEDTQAREDIEKLKNAKRWIGNTTTALTDGATTNPIIVDGTSVTAIEGDVAGYGNDEFIFNGTIWQKSDLSFLGRLAYKNNAKATYTPMGTVSAPTITVTPQTGTVNSAEAKTVMDGVTVAEPTSATIANNIVYWEVQGKNLILKNLIPSTTSSIINHNTIVATGISSAVSTQPTFTGVQATITSE